MLHKSGFSRNSPKKAYQINLFNFFEIFIGHEQPVILEDNHYDFNFQASRQVPDGRGHVLPGDELILECEYSTTGIIAVGRCAPDRTYSM